MGIEKLPTAGNRGLDPSTNSVSIDVGKTAAEGERQGNSGNRDFNDGMSRRSGNSQPGNSVHYPKVGGYDD